MNLTKIFKSGIASLFIIIIGFTLLLTVGFNKSFDFTGGTIISINIAELEFEDAKLKVNEVLAENNLYASSFVKGENDTGECLFVKYQVFEDINLINEQVYSDLFLAFDFDLLDDLEAKYIIMQTDTTPLYGSDVFIKGILASFVALIGVAIYIIARHNLTTGFVLVATAILDLGIMFSLTLITRIPISHFISLAILGTTVISLLINFLTLNRINENAKKEENAFFNNSKLVEMSIKESGMKSLYIGIIIIAMLLLISIGIESLASFALVSLLLGVFACVFSSYYIAPTLWALAYFRKTKKIKSSKVNKSSKASIDKDLKQVEVNSNYEDDAE